MSHSSELSDLSGLLAFAAPDAAPPADLRSRVLARVEREASFYFRFADEPGWESPGPDGASLKRLSPDDSPEGAVELLTLLPGTAHSPEAASGTEYCYVVSGEVESGAGNLGVGDFIALQGERRVLRVRDGAAVVLLIRVRGGMSGERRERVIRSVDGDWSPLAPGTLVRSLADDRAEGAQIALVRMEAGASVEGHAHRGTEALYMLTGDCRCAEEELGPGDYHRAEAGSTHAITSTRGGCTMILVTYVPRELAA